MANKTQFAGLRDALIPQTDTVNSENAPAYALAPKQALAQYSATGPPLPALPAPVQRWATGSGTRCRSSRAGRNQTSERRAEAAAPFRAANLRPAFEVCRAGR